MAEDLPHPGADLELDIDYPVECRHCDRAFDSMSALDMHFIRNRCPEHDTRSTREKVHEFLVYTVLAWLFDHPTGVQSVYRIYRCVRYGR